MNSIHVEELLAPYENYLEGWRAVTQKVENGILIPIKNSGSNGMKPSLYQRYRRAPKPKKDKSGLLESLQSEVFPPLSIAHYKKHLVQYEKDREMILALQSWLLDHPKSPAPASVNERSFEIFCREKVLAEHGERLLSNLQLEWSCLNVYETCEPLSTYSSDPKPGPVLIVENLDPFVTIRKLMIEGQKTICGQPVATVVYGKGKNIVKTFRDFLDFGSPQAKASLDQLYYWGDLDWEGIQIYESLCARWPDQTFHLFIPAYQEMIKKAAGLNTLPLMKEGQKENWDSPFLESLDQESKERLCILLKERRYIPQEILTAQEYSQADREEDSDAG